MGTMDTDQFCEGEQARISGLSLKDNPYKGKSGRLWIQGWCDRNIILNELRKPICKNCKYFNWKLSVTRNWGECQSETVQSAIRLSLTLVNLSKDELDKVRQYARFQFDEDTFGCVFYESED